MSILFAFLFLGQPEIENIKCGIRPITPLGCSKSNAVCVCDSSGRECEWIFIGCR